MAAFAVSPADTLEPAPELALGPPFEPFVPPFDRDVQPAPKNIEQISAPQTTTLAAPPRVRNNKTTPSELAPYFED